MNVFLDSLINHSTSVSPISQLKLQALDKTYNLSLSNNCEIKLRWQLLCLKSGTPWIVDNVVEFITAQGRMKYVRPLYRALNGCSAVNGSQIAKSTFLKHHLM